MSWKLKQIFLPNPNLADEYPNYENQLQPRMRFADSELRLLFEQHEAAIMGIVVREITAYLADESVCNDEEDMFPRRSEMTGEWYVGEIELFKKEERIWGSVFTRFLGYYPEPCAAACG